ncbi:MAG TPA: sulfurtransferase [Pseudonocardia sp.]|jgi:thiosulfate/3-mercaptopyruvate sulfurtransferase|nr:sulfurtransferase [Sporichthyaceae bacterium]HZZ48138.1 sulfurtransferase [Pseudonocardia sp.]
MPATLPPLVSADELAAAHATGGHRLLVLDATTHLDVPVDGQPYTVTADRDGYLAEHIPDAVFADVPGAWSDPEGAFAFAVPTPEQFSAAAGALGIGDDTHVVAYDTANNAWATRVWWLMRVFGHDAVSVLDGGLAAWKAAGHPVGSGAVSAEPARFTARFRPELVADKERVRRLSESGGSVVNALDPATFLGQAEKNPYARRGRIPGSTNLPFFTLLDQTTGRFLDTEALRETLVAGGLLSGEETVTYCGGGIAATLPAFAAYVVAGTEIAVYDGSLSEWTADPSQPVQVG